MGQRPSGGLPPPPDEWVHQSQLLVEGRQTRFDRGVCNTPRQRCVEVSLHYPRHAGLASAHRVRTAAHVASWADSLKMVRKRHPHIAATMIRNLEVGTSPSFQFVRDCKDSLVDARLDLPSWNVLSLPRPVEEAELEPNQPKFGWQQQASRQMEKKFVSDHLWPRFDNVQRALMRSQCGPLASAALTALHPGPPELTHSLSAFSCAAGCTPADVAAYSTSLGTIVLCV